MKTMLTALVAMALLLTACGGDDDTDDTASASDGAEQDTETEAAERTMSVETPTEAPEPPAEAPADPPAAPEDLPPEDEGAVLGQADTSLPGELIQSGYDGPFFMVNLIEFRDQAVYADGRETDLTGVEANNLYGQTGVQVLVAGGMRPALAGAVDAGAAPDAVPAWDQVAIARYPSYQEFFALSQSPELQVGLEHKDAGVETTIVIPTLRVEDALPAAELPPADDPVVLFEIFSHDGDGMADRPGPLSDYVDALAADATDLGGVALGTYEVQGVLIGDGREWDEAHLWWFADRADLDALLADADLAAATAARDEVLADHYRLVLEQVQVEPLGRQP